MKRCLIAFLFLAEVTASMAQVIHGNEWIDHSRQYWRFNVHADGLVRIDSASLANNGFPIATVDPADLMVFGREKQVPIYIQGGDDGILNTGDFIEFFVERNDGWLDTQMYNQPQQQANPFYSLYNDTIRYYITWDPIAPKERVQAYENTAFDNYPMRPYAMGSSFQQSVARYRPGAVDGNNLSSGFMTEGEGWFHNALLEATQANGAAEQVWVLPTPNRYTGSEPPLALVTTGSASTNDPGGFNTDDHHLKIAYGASAPGTTAVDTIFRGVKVIKSAFQVPHSELGANISIRFQVPYDLFQPGQIGASNPNSYIDRQAFAQMSIRYARDFNFAGSNLHRLWLPNGSANDPAHIDFVGLASPIIYAWVNGGVNRILPTQVVASWKALILENSSLSETALIAFAGPSVTAISALKPVNGTGFFSDMAALELDSAMLIVTHSTLREEAEEYAAYRRTSPRNPMPVLITDVDELYDQFGGGIPKHAMAIRRFARYIVNTWSTDPQAMFLIGKSVQTVRINNSTLAGFRPDGGGAYERCLIPSYGYPSSDPCFTLGLRFDTRKVDIPLGRLSAQSGQDVRDYLEKVRSFEDQPPAAWMKNILHFRGGFTVAENALHAAYMSGWKQLAEAPNFGGNVVNFSKISSDVIQQASGDSVRQFIEEGVTLMTFLAHAYANGFDISIENPANYQWNGKHPMVIANSCYIGNVHLNANSSTSEDWVMLPEKGPIAFLASVDAATAANLNPYTREFYRSFSQVNYGKSIGEHMRHASFQQLSSSSNVSTLHNVHTFTLQGDPTLILNSWPEPDYTVRAEDIYFSPDPVTADVDTFTVKAVVRNIGKAISGDVNVAVDRTNPGLNALQTQLSALSNVYLRDTAVFRLPTRGFSGGQGINQITVRVDLDPDEVPELDDLGNNSASSSLFITSGDLVPVYPYNYAILPDAAPALKASTGDPFAPMRNYVFQIDTADTFNSPVLETATVNAPGGVVTWQPSSVYAQTAQADSTVYFWRCSIDSTGNGGYSWYERSFQYIPGKHGWGQAQFFQFKNNTFDGMVHDRPDREFEFFSGTRTLRGQVRGNSGASSNDSTVWFLEVTPQDYNGCNVHPAWHVVALDPANFRPWGTFWQGQNPTHRFSNQNDGAACRNRVEFMFSFRTNVDSQMVGMQRMIEDSVPNGHHLFFYTWKYLDKDGMANNAPGLMPYFEQLGLPDWDIIPDSVPMIFYTRKGSGTVEYVNGQNINEFIEMSVAIEGLSDRGEMTTMEAGPANAWYGLYWNDRPRNIQDSTLVEVHGITPSGAELPLFTFPAAQDSFPDLGNFVDAQLYPRLKLRGRSFDIGTADPDPSQMQRWQLLSAPVPECAIDPPSGYLNALNDLFEGQDASVAVAVRNISAFDMDSLLLGAWIIDRNNVRRPLHYHLNAPLPAGAFLIDTIHFSTLGFGGANTLVIEANTVDTTTNAFHQPEQYRFNNIAQLRFLVEEDLENPLLDVTFDGARILDGDVVSSKPEIMVTLKDENPVLLMDSPADTAYFKVFISGPGMPLQQLYFRDGAGVENLQFIPANGPNNLSSIMYRPRFDGDGRYTFVVQATDKSNNRSGDYDYKINFEVINKPTITEVLNYPNPFTTSTRFVFTVTGSEAPTYMKIQIMTVTGRVVREVRHHEIGPIRVGRNISEFAWDGTDEFGDKLARGVYLYRVIAQLNGQDIEYRSTGASEYFHKGMGKMYLLR